MSTFRIGQQTIEADHPHLQAALATVHHSADRPACLCREPAVPMYVAKVGGHYLLKRMPGTGSAHDSACDAYEPPAELSGLGEVLGTAIQENVEEGTTSLKFAFSLSKRSGRAAPVPTGQELNAAQTVGSKLGLRGTLHYLWEQAGFHQWTPSMAGKRNWNVVRKYLLLAAEAKLAKGVPLTKLLYIPESFVLEHKEATLQRQRAQLRPVLTPTQAGTQSLMLLLGEVKQIAPSRFGQKLLVKHLPDCPLMLNEELHRRLLRLFENELTLWSAIDGAHLMVLGTFSAGPTGILSFQEMALMVVNQNWIPIENLYDQQLVSALSEAHRRFVKGLRYNLPVRRPLASVVLSDTQPRPVAMYLTPPSAGEKYETELAALINSSELASWCWHTETEEMPAFPSRQ